jgi:hypothetical protein
MISRATWSILSSVTGEGGGTGAGAEAQPTRHDTAINSKALFTHDLPAPGWFDSGTTVDLLREPLLLYRGYRPRSYGAATSESDRQGGVFA